MLMIFSIFNIDVMKWWKFITFSLLGTFIVSLDDSSTRIYNSNAFLNGDSDRIVPYDENGILVKEAYEKTIDQTGKISFAYMNTILEGKTEKPLSVALRRPLSPRESLL